MAGLNYDSFNSLRHNVTDLRAGAHCVYNINMHLVLVAAYRRKAISSAVMNTIQEVLHRILDRLEVRILEFSGEADHVHLLISRHPVSLFLTLLTESKQQRAEKFGRDMLKRLPLTYGALASGRRAIVQFLLGTVDSLKRSNNIFRRKRNRANARSAIHTHPMLRLATHWMGNSADIC